MEFLLLCNNFSVLDCQYHHIKIQGILNSKLDDLWDLQLWLILRDKALLAFISPSYTIGRVTQKFLCESHDKVYMCKKLVFDLRL